MATAKKITKKKTTRKKVAKKKRKPGRPKGSKNLKKPGRPKGSGKKRGRPRGRKVARKAKGSSIVLPVGSSADIGYWSELVMFLNSNKGKSFTVQMDGVSYSLNAG